METNMISVWFGVIFFVAAIESAKTGQLEMSLREKRSVDADLTEENAILRQQEVQEAEVKKRRQTFRDKHHMEHYIVPGVILGVPLIIMLTCGVKATVETCCPLGTKQRKSLTSAESPGSREKRMGSGRKWDYWRPPTVVTETNRTKRGSMTSQSVNVEGAGTRPDSAFHMKEFPFTSPEPKSFRTPYYLSNNRKGRKSITTKN